MPTKHLSSLLFATGRGFVALAFACSTLTVAPSYTEAAGEDVRILLVGSSLTNGIKPRLKQMIEDSGLSVYIHTENCNACALDVDHAAPGSSARDAIQFDGPWNFIVLQEASPIACDLSQYFRLTNGVGQLYDYAKVYAPGAEIVLYMPHTKCADAGAGCPVDTAALSVIQQMHTDVASDVGIIGTQPPIRIAPVGQAVYEFCNQNSAVGIQTNSEHLTDRGKYLAAMTIYGALFRKDPATVAFKPSYLQGLKDEYEEAAYEPLFNAPRIWNNPMPRQAFVNVSASKYDADKSIFVSAFPYPMPTHQTSIFHNWYYTGFQFLAVGIEPGADVTSAIIYGHVKGGGEVNRPLEIDAELQLPQSDALWTGSNTGYNTFAGGLTTTRHEDQWPANETHFPIIDATTSVQTLVDNPVWAQGKSMTFITRGRLDGFVGNTGIPSRTICSQDGSAAGLCIFPNWPYFPHYAPPQLVIDYEY